MNEELDLKAETHHQKRLRRKETWEMLKIIGFVVLSVTVLSGLGLSRWGIPAPQQARSALYASGFQEVETQGSDPFVCNGEIFNTKFTATNSSGQRVSGVVCCGLVKSCSVRF